MAIVERLLPRHWGGRRLLQFLAGLALLALSFTPRVDVVATPAAPAPVSAAARAEVSASETDQIQEPGAVPEAEVIPVFSPMAVAVEPEKMLDSECQHDAAPRAPPLA